MKTIQINNSSRVSALQYDEWKQELIITYKRGGDYKYFNVPESEYISLIQAESVGKFINQNIKPKYAFIKLG